MDDRRAADAGDDYSYDLVHEVPDTPGHTGRSRRRPAPTPVTPDAPPEEGSDYSYDLAHEVPQAQSPRRQG